MALYPYRQSSLRKVRHPAYYRASSVVELMALVIFENLTPNLFAGRNMHGRLNMRRLNQ